MEALAEGEIAVLGASDLDVAIAGELGGHGEEGLVAGQGFVQGGGEQAGFEAGGAQKSLLAEGGTLEREQLLRIGRLVDGDQVIFEAGNFVELFETDDGEGGGREAVLAGVLRGAGLAFEGAGAGGMLCVGAVGSALLVGDGLGSVGQGRCLSISAIAWGRAGV